MNSNRYRTIFSKRLGMLVAVAETTKAQGKGSGAAPGSGARVGRGARSPDADRSLLTTAASHATSMTRIALAVGSTLGFSAQALAADECGVEAVGADTITCTDPAYAGGIVYTTFDGLTLNLNNAAMVIGPVVGEGVRIFGDSTNTNDIVINAMSFDLLTASDTGLIARNDGTAGNAAITLTNGRVMVSGDGNSGLLSEIANPNAIGAARVTMNGGSVQTDGADAEGLWALQSGLGNAETLMTGGTITLLQDGSAGLRSEILNPNSTATARVTMSGGSISSAAANGMYGYTLGSGSVEALMTDGAITAEETGMLAETDGSSASLLVRMEGGSITSLDSAGLRADNNGGGGDVTVVMTNGTIMAAERGINAGSSGNVRATMSGGSITSTNNGSSGIRTTTDSGDSIITMIGGAIFMTGNFSEGLYAINDGASGANQVIMSGGTVDLQGQGAVGILFERGDAGANSLTMSGGTVSSSGINADGIQTYWGSDDATYDFDLTGGSVTGGSGFGAAIRLQAPAGGTVDIGSAATVTAGASGIALVVGADPWDGVIYNTGDLVLTTAGTVTGDVLLGLGTDVVNVTGGTLNGDIVGNLGDTVNFSVIGPKLVAFH